MDQLVSGHCIQTVREAAHLLFYKLSIAQYYDRRQRQCVRLVVEPNSTPVRDILVAPIRFVVDINKLHFAESSALFQWKLKGE